MNLGHSVNLYSYNFMIISATSISTKSHDFFQLYQSSDFQLIYLRVKIQCQLFVWFPNQERLLQIFSWHICHFSRPILKQFMFKLSDAHEKLLISEFELVSPHWFSQTRQEKNSWMSIIFQTFVTHGISSSKNPSIGSSMRRRSLRLHIKVPATTGRFLSSRVADNFLPFCAVIIA